MDPKEEKTLALLKLLAQGEREAGEGKLTDNDKVFAKLEKRLKSKGKTR